MTEPDNEKLAATGINPFLLIIRADIKDGDDLTINQLYDLENLLHATLLPDIELRRFSLTVNCKVGVQELAMYRQLFTEAWNAELLSTFDAELYMLADEISFLTKYQNGSRWYRENQKSVRESVKNPGSLGIHLYPGFEILYEDMYGGSYGKDAIAGENWKNRMVQKGNIRRICDRRWNIMKQYKKQEEPEYSYGDYTDQAGH